MFMVLITLIAAEGWTGLLIKFGVVPLPAILLAVGMSLCESRTLCYATIATYLVLCALGITKQTELPGQLS